MSPRCRSCSFSAISTDTVAFFASGKLTFALRSFGGFSGSGGHLGSGPGAFSVRAGVGGVGRMQRPLATAVAERPAAVGATGGSTDVDGFGAGAGVEAAVCDDGGGL